MSTLCISLLGVLLPSMPTGAINTTDKNLVKGWIGPTAPECFEVYAEYAYDALGRRIRATLGGVTNYFYYDGQNVVAEYEWDYDLLRYYVHGSTYIDERAILHDAANDEEYYYALRELYTVEALLNNRAHEVERYTYDAYGMPTITILHVQDVDFDGDVDGDDNDLIDLQDGLNACAVGPFYDTNGDGVIDYTDKPSGPPYPPGMVLSPASGVGNPYAFTGRRMDHLDNFLLLLYHYRAREYDPFHGRFLQRDPVGYLDGMNLYEYASSRPTSLLDSLGLQGNEPALPFTTGPVADIDAFLTHYVLRSGEPLFLTRREANEAMDTLGVEMAVDNAGLVALGEAKKLPCNPPDQIREEITIPIKGEAIARRQWRLILQKFNFQGHAKCVIRKDCVCSPSNKACYRAHASCSIHLTGRDTYDFHVFPLTAIPGVPYNILWTWTTSINAKHEKRDRGCAQATYPPPFAGGGGASW